jgi:hypothetical protein
MNASDPRKFAEDVIYETIRPLVIPTLPIYRETDTKKNDSGTDFYVSILTEEEAEIMPMANVFVLEQSVVLVSELGTKENEGHLRYRQQLREALYHLMAVQNLRFKDRGKFYGCFVKQITKANVKGAYGDIFYLETRVGV